jgi:DNA-nicking Smr family endonuclease
MTRRGPGSKRGTVSETEHALWAKAIRDVTPLRGGDDEVTEQGEEVTAAPETTPTAGPPKDAAAPVGPPRHERPRPVSPPLTGLDRRTRQRLARGQADYEARLDLHGLSVENARLALARFLAESVAKGRRLVLVITGKGAAPFARHTLHGASHFDTPERQGRLRRKLPEWLAEDDLRGYVAGYQPAHPRHGGGGAFYVRIRRRERLGRFI